MPDIDRDDLAVDILMTGNGPGSVADVHRAYSIADAVIEESGRHHMILDMLREIKQQLGHQREMLDHQHDMLHAQSEVQIAHGKLLHGIAAAVKKLEPGIDPELAAALIESQKHHDALKVALDAQAPVMPLAT